MDRGRRDDGGRHQRRDDNSVRTVDGRRSVRDERAATRARWLVRCRRAAVRLSLDLKDVEVDWLTRVRCYIYMLTGFQYYEPKRLTKSRISPLYSEGGSPRGARTVNGFTQGSQSQRKLVGFCGFSTFRHSSKLIFDWNFEGQK